MAIGVDWQRKLTFRASAEGLTARDEANTLAMVSGTDPTGAKLETPPAGTA